ncbi:hypothetical protein GCM10009765_09810 [Fodinicola feengrottensis]|uniref:Uncharacterized protein n=1 Tax=Fodinicola feengrottensis TaxID=435914 RepID=A0ABP4RX28_9ACTN
MAEQSVEGDPRRQITDRLKAAGWSREESAENLDWPDFAFENDDADLEFSYTPGDDWVRLGLLTEENEGYLKIDFDSKLDALLDAVVAVQEKLNADYWDQFIDELLAIPVRVYAVGGDDGDELTELTMTSSELE